MTKRWFNYRPICLVFAFLLLGSIFAFYLTNYKVATIIIAFTILMLLLILSFKKKNIKLFLVPFIAFIVGVVTYNLGILSFSKTISEVPTQIEARIYSINKVDDGVLVAEGDSCCFDSIQVSDKITIRVYDNTNIFENLEIGSVIKFIPISFYKSDLFYHDTPNASMYASNLKYTAMVDAEDIIFIKNSKTLAEIIKSKIKTNLAKGLTNENVEITYSSLFGEKELLPEKQYEYFRLSGVAHLLAVSGLHVGIITAVLYKLLDLCKIKRWWKFFIVGIILLMYAYICNFAVSIIRATIMSLVVLLSNIAYREYDSLTSISLAGILMFFINPLSAFDVGFLMSFSCVIGITLLTKSIQGVLYKTKINRKIIDSLAISLSTSVSLMFIMAFFFKTLNIISIFANIIIIPLFTIAFIAMFACSILSLAIPAITILLYPFNYLLSFITILSNILGGLPISNFATVTLPYFSLVIYFALLLVLSRFCLASYKEKVVVTLPLVALLVCCLV